MPSEPASFFNDNHPLQLYLQEQGIKPLGNVVQQIVQLLEQKDEQLKGLQMQVTKSKAQNVKNSKMIAQLQQKIGQMCPNSNNTGSSFMMASQFKEFFQDFIKNSVPVCMAPLSEYPTAYVQYTQLLLTTSYQNVKKSIDEKIASICKILKLQTNTQNQLNVKNCLLRIMQNNWQSMFEFENRKQYFAEANSFKNEQIQQILKSEQFQDVSSKLIKICVYMLLQQKSWDFVIQNSKVDFNKKEHTCIDGWLKEGSRALLVLEGLVKENEQKNSIRHANLKNYVIPDVDDEERYQLIPKQIKKQIQNENKVCLNIEKSQKKTQSPSQKSQQKKSSSTKQLIKNESIISISRIKNTQTGIKRIQKQQQKTPALVQVQSISFLLSPQVPRICKNSHQNSNNTLKLINNQLTNQNNSLVHMAKSSKLKTSKQTNNLVSDASFEQILPLQHKRNVDQLPLRRDSKTKKSSSRKASAGKIVGQNIELKQNNANKGNKDHKDHKDKQNISKQCIYKDMIKHKLGGEHKTQRTKDSKYKQKEQDRPLRVMHIKKIRQKYLNL